MRSQAVWVTKERKAFVTCPVSVLMCWYACPQMDRGHSSHTPGTRSLLPSTACARAHKSEKKKGLHWQWLRLGIPSLGSWHIGFLLFFLAPGTPSSFAGRTQLQDVVSGTLPHPLADLSRDPVARLDGMCGWWKKDLSKARGPLWEGLGHLACSSFHSGYPHILSQ